MPTTHHSSHITHHTSQAHPCLSLPKLRLDSMQVKIEESRVVVRDRGRRCSGTCSQVKLRLYQCISFLPSPRKLSSHLTRPLTSIPSYFMPVSYCYQPWLCVISPDKLPTLGPLFIAAARLPHPTQCQGGHSGSRSLMNLHLPVPSRRVIQG